MITNRYGRYDRQLAMYVEPGHEFNLPRLRFLRWLAERGRLEHPVAGPSTGPLARIAAAVPEPRPQGRQG